jgi:hypothetical protein
MQFDSFDEDVSDVEIPGYEETPELDTPEGEKTTDDLLSGSKDRRLLSQGDVWDTPAPRQPKAEAEDTPTGEQEETGEEQKAAEPPKPAVKSLAFKAGDQNIEVPETATVAVKVDGKLVEVPVTELATNYSGKVAWDKRFSELTNEKRNFATERQKFASTQAKSQSLLNDMHKAITSGDTFGAIASLVSVSGLEGKIDPRKFVSELRSAMSEQALRMSQMDETERAQLEAREEYEYTKKQLETLRQQRENEQKEYSTQVEFAKKMQEHSVGTEDLQTAYDYLVNDGAAHGIDATKLTPDELLNYALTVREFQTAIGALRDVSPDIAENRQYQDEAVKILRAYPGTTKEQLAEVFREAVGSKRSESASKKATKSPNPTPATAKARAKVAPAGKSKADFFAGITSKSDIW